MKKIKKIVTLSILICIISNLSNNTSYDPDGGISVYSDDYEKPHPKN